MHSNDFRHHVERSEWQLAVPAILLVVVRPGQHPWCRCGDPVLSESDRSFRREILAEKTDPRARSPVHAGVTSWHVDLLRLYLQQ